MATKAVKLEFINDEARSNMINQRLQGVEQEVLNAQIDLAIEEGVAASLKDGDQLRDGQPGSKGNIRVRAEALANATARLEALRGLRDGAAGKD